MSYRQICLVCRLPLVTCYCGKVEKFNPNIMFVILSHYREAQKKIATGRMAHLHLAGSLLIEGYDYSNCSKVNAIINDGANLCYVLYPGDSSDDLADPKTVGEIDLKLGLKRLVIFVIDGTWITARKTMQRSDNLARLPRIKLSPKKKSQFLVRKQPFEYCLSTIEAIHDVIECFGRSRDNWNMQIQNDRMIQVFSEFVNKQLKYLNHFSAREHPPF